MNEQLRLFHDNTLMFQAVEQYFAAKLEELTVKLVKEGIDTKGMTEAFKVIDRAFSSIREEFSPPADKNTTNHAR